MPTTIELETVSVEGSAPLMQGDIFEWRKKGDCWQQYGIILTTDCDLDKCKNDDVYSYCPISPIALYFRDIFAYSRIEPDKLLSTISKRIYPDRVVDSNALLSLLLELGSSKSLSHFGPRSEKVKDHIRLLCQYYSKSDPPIETWLLSHAVNGKKYPDVHSFISGELKTFLLNLPGDLFYFNAIEGTTEMGFLVNLRRVGMLSRHEIGVSWSELRNDATLVKRISTLQSPYKYHLSKKFADVFSSIGLPDSYEKDRIAAIDLIATALEGEKHV